MRLAVWSDLAARGLGYALGRAESVVSDVVTLAPHEARAALGEGTVDLALVPTLDVLRDALDEDGAALEAVPGVGLVVQARPEAQLWLKGGLEDVGTVSMDPRWAQEALLAQIVLKEHYGVTPAFSPSPDPASAEGSALVASGTPSVIPDGTLALDLGQEWLELTTRPFVWGLLVASAGTLTPEQAFTLRRAAREGEQSITAAALDRTREGDGAGAPPDRMWRLTLDGYAQDGLDEWVRHLYYHGSLEDFAQIPFLTVPEDDEAA